MHICVSQMHEKVSFYINNKASPHPKVVKHVTMVFFFLPQSDSDSIHHIMRKGFEGMSNIYEI